MKDAVLDLSGKVLSDAVTLNVGNFFQVVFDFTIVALAIFVFIKTLNKLSAKQEPAPAAPPAPSKEVVLLTEIRDLLKK
jgi:large conductance mechanosensitive channel